MEQQAPYRVVSEAFALPAPSEETLRRDLLQRTAHRLRLEMSGLRNAGGSIDWRIGATYALDQVRQARVGVVPMATYYAREIAPSHFAGLHERLQLLLGQNVWARRLRLDFEQYGMPLGQYERLTLQAHLRGQMLVMPTGQTMEGSRLCA